MAHGREADAYDYLATSKVSELTVAQLEQALQNSFLNKSNIEFWKGPVTMNRVMEVSRTYPHGLSIPEQSIIAGEAVNPGDSLVLQPPDSELWNIIAIAVTAPLPGTPAVTVNAYDGSTDVLMHGANASTTTTSFFPWGAPIPLTNTAYIRISNVDLSDAIFVEVAYHKVGL